MRWGNLSETSGAVIMRSQYKPVIRLTKRSIYYPSKLILVT